MKTGQRPSEKPRQPGEWALVRDCGKQSTHGSLQASKHRANQNRSRLGANAKPRYKIYGPNGESLTGRIGPKISRAGVNRIEWNEK